MRRIRMGKRIAACLTAVMLAAGTLAGCGGRDVETADTENAAADAVTADGEEEQENGMGRFVEKKVSLGDDSLTDWNSRVFRQEDGSLLLADNSGFVLRSDDNGESWEREELPWLTKMSEEGKWIMSMAIGPDGTAAVVYTDPVDPEDAGEMEMKLLLIKSDNTEIPVEVNLAPEDMFLNAVFITDSGRVLACAGGANLYEVKEDGSSEIYLTVDAPRIELVRFHGNLMLLDGFGMETPLIYDMEARKYIEDDVLAEFVKENFSSRDSYIGRNYDLFLVSGGDDAIYAAGKKGVYRHVLGGSAMEQVLDGNLSVLSNPANSIMDVFVVNHDEFIVLFTGGGIMRFVYDPEVPSRPNEKLLVWSLEDEPVVRQAISVYQTENPAVYVEYEVGLDGAAMTREDAIKSMNTRMMAGEGPDVLILDDMPLDSYIEKEILMDIAPLLDGMSGDEAVFPNVKEAFRTDKSIYTVPCEIRLPYVFGNGSDMEKMTSLSGVADVVEQIRQNHPDGELLQIPSPRGIMRIYAMASAAAWRTEDGAVNVEAVSEFLTQTKRMYDAQMDGVSEEALQEWKQEQAVYEAYDSVYGETFEDSDQFREQRQGIYSYMGGRRKLVAGAMGNVDDYTCQSSVFLVDDYKDCRSVPMSGQCSNVFWAKTLLGISTTSQNKERAQEFVRTALGADVQNEIQSGFSVNKKAILDNYANQWRLYKDNDYVSGSASIDSEDGVEVDFLIRVPDEKKVNELIQWIESMDTAYVEDTTFENVIYEEGDAYMRGEKSMEDAMASIETRLGIYVTE